MRQIFHCPRCGFSDEDLRTPGQSSRMWAALYDISQQVEWAVDGKMQYMAPEDWKDLLTAALKQSTRVAHGINGGFVILGAHTSRMTRGVMAELLDLIYAFGHEKEVKFSDKATP